MSSSYSGHGFSSVQPSEELMVAIVKARLGMITDAPFFGNLVMRLELIVVPDDDPMIKTAATDGRYLLVNGKFFMDISPSDRTLVIGHELGHSILDHAGEHGRRLDRDPGNWNTAADHIVNNMNVECHIGTPMNGSELRLSNGMVLYCDKKYKDWSVEMVYADLPPSKGGGGGGQPGKGGKGGQVLDEHIESGSIQPNGVDENGNTKYRIAPEGTVTEGEKRKVQNEMRAAVIGATKTAEARGGNVPSGVKRLLDEWLESKIDWRELIATNISDLFQDDYTYARPSKKSWSTNVILPGFSPGEHVDLAAAIDMSGSIGQKEATIFLSELNGIMQAYESFKIHLWTYDTKTYNYKVFTEENLDELKEYEVMGGGGTSFECNYDFMEEIELRPGQFINFTDGEPNDTWGDPNYTDTVFVILNPRRPKPPFGKFAYFEDA